MSEGSRGSAVASCEREVLRWIVSGEVSPGSRLPPERALAAKLGVNRTTLRAALARLASARLLRVRQGSGYVVQDYRKVAGLELLPELASHAPDGGVGFARELLELRRRLVRMALEHCAQRGSAADLTGVSRALERLSALVASGARPERLAEADHEVCAAILAAGGSAVVGLCFNPVSVATRELEGLRDAMFSEPRAQLAMLESVLRWLERPDVASLGPLLEALERRDAEVLERAARPQDRPPPPSPQLRVGK